MSIIHIRKKICLLGDSAVGKTSLIRRCVYDVFDDKYISTLGTKVTKKSIFMNNTHITLLLWDIIGSIEYADIHPSFYKGAEGAIIVGDLSQENTIKNMLHWYASINSICSNIIAVVVANKCDLIDKKNFNFTEFNKTTKIMKSNGYITSAKTGENVIEMFHSLSKILCNRS